MVHRRARLTPLGRCVVVERVLVEGWPVARVAEAASVSRPTVYKWVRRFQEEGVEGLNDRSSAPHRRPRALPAEAIEEIVAARRRLKQGPHRLAYALGRIPPGGGWRLLGRGQRSTEDRERRLGSDYLHVALDDHSRLAFVEVHPDERANTVVGFLARACRSFEEHGAHVERVMTDNAWCYTRSPKVRQLLRDHGIRHLLIPPRRPQVNGKVERFNRTMLEEWAYATLYRSNEDRLATLQTWVGTYNRDRPHTALGGRPPASRLSTT